MHAEIDQCKSLNLDMKFLKPYLSFRLILLCTLPHYIIFLSAQFGPGIQRLVRQGFVVPLRIDFMPLLSDLELVHPVVLPLRDDLLILAGT